MNLQELAAWDREAAAALREVDALLGPVGVAKPDRLGAAVNACAMAVERQRIALENRLEQIMLHEHAHAQSLRGERERVFLGWCRTFAAKMGAALTDIVQAVQLDLWGKLVEVRSLGQLAPPTLGPVAVQNAALAQIKAVNLSLARLQEESEGLDAEKDQRTWRYEQLNTMRENQNALSPPMGRVRATQRLVQGATKGGQGTTQGMEAGQRLVFRRALPPLPFSSEAPAPVLTWQQLIAQFDRDGLDLR